MSDITQANRLLKITTPLGADVLVLRRLSVLEAIGQLFTIDAECISSQDSIAPGSIVGLAITCVIQGPTGTPLRHFNGIVRSFARTGALLNGLSTYSLQAVPLMWHMTRTTDCKIFQAKSAKDILTTLFGDSGVAPNQFGTVPTTPRPYCLQFNETDFEFASRLLDEIGASYYFKHADGQHTLCVTGANADFPTIPGDDLVVREDFDRPNAVTRWQPINALQRGKMVARDFDGIKPSQLLTSESPTKLTIPSAATYEVFHWPSGKMPRPDIDPAKLEMEQDEVQADEVHADTQTPQLYAGGKVKVKEGLTGTGKSYVVTAVRHQAFDEAHTVTGGATGYANSVVLIPADRTFRNAHPRRRPVVPGVMSAVVTGPLGEEQYTDEYGRVKVQFHWDRLGGKDDKTTCFIRVAQPWAGAWGGTWFLPRIKDEVLVAFLDGDIDRPVVIGSVYNDDGKPPWTLPGKMTRSGIRSRSTKGGTRANANIIGIDDKKGSEVLYFQAEKDNKILVKNDQTEDVKHDRITTIYNADTLTVKQADRKVTLENGNLSTTIKMGNETREISMGNLTTNIKMGNETRELGMGNRETTLKMGNEKLTLNMGNLDTKLMLGNHTTELTLGNLSIKCDLGAVTIEALQGITLKCGPTTSIKLDPMGVTIEGMMLSSKATLMQGVEGLMTTVKGTAMTKLNGAIVMIGPG